MLSVLPLYSFVLLLLLLPFLLLLFLLLLLFVVLLVLLLRTYSHIHEQSLYKVNTTTTQERTKPQALPFLCGAGDSYSGGGGGGDDEGLSIFVIPVIPIITPGC